MQQAGLDISEEWAETCDIAAFGLHERISEPTETLVDVMRSFPVDILVHPQNRLLNERQPLDLDLDQLMAVAQQESVAIEINAQPSRLDLDWRSVKSYRNDVVYTIGTDAHTVNGLDHMHLGVSQARRGWCGPPKIINTWPLEDVLHYFDDQE